MKNLDKEFILKFLNIFTEAEIVGIDTCNLLRQFKSLKSYKKKPTSKKIFFNSRNFRIFLIPIILLAIFIILILFASKYFSFYFLYELFKPPVDCSFCKNISTIPKLKNLNSTEFEHLYAYSSVPLIITDATYAWKAAENFNITFFSHLYLNIYKNYSECNFFDYGFNLKNLRQFLTKNLKSLSPWYIGWATCDEILLKKFHEYYSKPYFLPDQSQWNSILWIFMGYPGLGAPYHIDKVDKPSWQAQILGSKHWSLESPPECFFVCNSMEAVVEKGEIFIIDTNIWYHSTKILGNEISLTIGSEFD